MQLDEIIWKSQGRFCQLDLYPVENPDAKFNLYSSIAFFFGEPTCQNENLDIEKNDIAAIDAPQRDHLEIPGTILIILSLTLSKFGMKIVLLVVHYSC